MTLHSAVSLRCCHQATSGAFMNSQPRNGATFYLLLKNMTYITVSCLRKAKQSNKRASNVVSGFFFKHVDGASPGITASVLIQLICVCKLSTVTKSVDI